MKSIWKKQPKQDSTYSVNNQYTILSKIDKGAYGMVFKGKNNLNG